MTPEDWQRVKPILDSALELDPANRPAFLRQACAEPSLRYEIESLIAAHEQAGTGALNSATLARSTLASGTKLGDFQILSLLGAGGMGEVYRARDLRLERDVAIKVLPTFVSLDPERLRRFEQEAKAAAALNHPNILAVFQMGSHEGAPYLVSELLEGETLREQVKRGPMPPKKTVDYGVQIAHGLAAAHEKGIVHRDLKPENLFITKDGRIKILDFGLAKLLHANGETHLTKQTLDTQPGAVMGTVGYMAPEQVRGLAADHRADIFAFGAILYELLTGKRAFHKFTFADTMSAILNEDPPPVSQVSPSVPPTIERAVQRCLEKNPEQRFQSASDLAFALELSSDSGSPSKTTPSSAKSRTPWKWIIAAGIAVVLVLGTLLWWNSRASARLTDKDTIVLADFTNTTGDPVFDDTLKQGLRVQLEQSPFLNILSDQKAREGLQLMGQKKDERLTKDLALDLCRRVGNKAVLAGSISGLGTHYVIALNALSCQTGDVLASEQIEADNRERTLKALDESAARLRAKFGESLASLQKYDVPLEQATTRSLEALEAYSQGMKVRSQKGYLEAIPFFRQAIELDPDFASAYASLSSCYANAERMDNLSADYLRKAFDLRDRASERERLRISNMFFFAGGEMQKALEAAKLWVQEYPRDKVAHVDLGDTYTQLGQYENSVAEYLEAVRLDPDDASAHFRVVNAYALANRLSEAKAAYQQGIERNSSYPTLHLFRYFLAFLENDAAEQDRQMAWAKGKPGVENQFLNEAAAEEVYFGRMRKGRELWQRAIALARQNEENEVAIGYEVSLAWAEAEYGNHQGARRTALAALAEKPSGRVQLFAAIALARAGDSTHSQIVNSNFEKRLQNYWLPTLRAANELNRNDAGRAIQDLQATEALELCPCEGELYTAYLRGLAYLLQRRATEAAAEFQKILDHHTIVGSKSQGALARLQIGRAYAFQGDIAKAKAAYQDFLTLWKDADPDIPILKEAKAEYSKLH